MQLHTYDLETVIGLLTDANVSSIYLSPFRHEEFRSVALFGQKSRDATTGLAIHAGRD